MTRKFQDRSVVVLGYDAASALGADFAKAWARALNGESGIGPLTRFPLDEAFPVRIAGQVEDIDGLDYPFLKPRELAKWTSPIFRYAMLTVSRALRKSGIEITDAIAPRVAVTYSSALGGIDAVLSADRRLVREKKLPPPFTNPNSCINMVGGKISILTGATGPITTTISACATGVTSMIIGAMFLEQGLADVAICGAVDFALVETILAGFATMNGTFYPQDNEPDVPSMASRPFSLNRRGFVVSEGAGAVIIATRDFARTWGLAYPAELAGWAMTSDANHVVAPCLPTVKRCMELALAHAGIEPGAVSAVNAHATSTRVGDKVEFDALSQVFQGKIPPVSANKSQIGHAMGSSSAIETIFALQGMTEDRILPTINFTPDPLMPLDCAAGQARTLAQEYVLKNAFGFGGCNACLVLRNTGIGDR
ncbi:MAG: beta-ketoacyl-[acyl-carrier-protein] synthase family protein [Pseudomonadota bacterium]